MKKIRTLITPLLAVAALAVGCGESGGDPDADPASVVPANAPVYVEATISPDGDTADAVDELASKLVGTDDPGAQLKQLFEQSANEGGGRRWSWDEDIGPWIGDRVGAFFTSLSGDSPQGAAVAPTDDPDAARDTLEEALAEQGDSEKPPKVEDREHNGVSYKLDTANDTAVAIVEDFAVVGNDAGVKAAIDAAEGEALAGTDQYEQARDNVDEDAVGFGYLKLGALVNQLGPQGAALQPLLGQIGDTTAFALVAESDAIRIETASIGVEGEGALDAGEMLGQVPGGAWLAVGTADIGGQLERALQQFGQLGAFGGVDIEQVLGQIQQASGIDLRADLLSWMGDGALFVRGQSIAELNGAFVVQSSDPAKTADVVPKLGQFISQAASELSVEELSAPGVDAGVTLRAQQLPLPIHIAAAGDRFVIAVTDAALQDAIDPSEVLQDSDAFKNASDKLGDGIGPSLFVDVEPLRGLIQATGAAAGQQIPPQVGRVLEQLTTIAAGTSREDDVARGRFVVGVK